MSKRYPKTENKWYKQGLDKKQNTSIESLEIKKPEIKREKVILDYEKGKQYQEYIYTGTVQCRALNVRTAPSIEAINISSYPVIFRNKKIKIYAQATDIKNELWYYVSIDGSKGIQFGFVKAEFIKVDK